MIRSVKHISVMSPYALAHLNAPVGKPLISLSQNESLRPPSPFVAEAAANALGVGHLYPDPEWRELRLALSELHSIPKEGILCGNGSMELIASLAQAFADEQNAVLAPAHSYPFFRTATQWQGRALMWLLKKTDAFRSMPYLPPSSPTLESSSSPIPATPPAPVSRALSLFVCVKAYQVISYW